MERSIERLARRSTWEPHIFLTLIPQATSISFTRGPTPYERLLNASGNAIVSCVHVQPTAANMCIKCEFWLSNLIGLSFPLPLKAEVLSAQLKACKELRCVHKNVYRERFGKIQKYEEVITIICSDPDNFDMKRFSLHVLYVDDNYQISFFMARTDLS